MAKLVDAPDLKSDIERCAGSTPASRTNRSIDNLIIFDNYEKGVDTPKGKL